MGEKLRELGVVGAVEHRAGRARAGRRTRSRRRSSMPDGTSRTITAAWVGGCDGAHSAVRELSGIDFPGRALRARVLRRRHGGDRQHGARRAQRLPVARGLPPALPDARQGPLAHRRHPAGGAARPATTSTFEDVIPSLRSEAGAGLVLQDLHLVLHLPHPPPQRRALPRPPLLPARRRGAHPQPGRRAGHEHRPAGRLQPGLEARARRRGPGGRGAARLLRGRAPAGRAAAAATRPTAPSGWSCPTTGWPACCARRSWPGSPPSR